MDRVKTGIAGFDELVEGGIPKGAVSLITGLPGTGKTIFGLQYLYNGALQGDNGLFVCIESSPDTLKAQAKEFGMDFDTLERQGKIFFLKVPLDNRKFNLFYMIDDVKKQINAKRIVFDNLATFTINLGRFVSLWGEDGRAVMESTTNQAEQTFHPMDEKRMAYSVIEQLRNTGATCLIVTFGDLTANKITTDGASEYISDGIIEMYNELVGAKRARTMSIRKMRNTNHDQYIHEFSITEKGIAIKPVEAVYQ